MTEKHSLVDLGDLSKPATTLIERVSDAIGGVFKPFQIVRVAKAEAQADIIRAESQIQIGDVQRRALLRFLNEEASKQINIEDVTRKSLPHLDESSRPQDIDRDWITHFFDRGRLISDDEMQELWARVLAGEANNPGSFSKRTVNALSTFDRIDGEIFTDLCSFGWHIGHEFVPVVFDYSSPSYAGLLNFSRLTHLDAIGLIQFDNLDGFTINKLPRRQDASYFGQTVTLEFEAEDNNSLEIGHVLLTQVGNELAGICRPRPVDGFFGHIRDVWSAPIRKAEGTAG